MRRCAGTSTFIGLLMVLLSGSGGAQVPVPPASGLLYSCTIDALKTVYSCLAPGDVRNYVIGAIWILRVPETNPGPIQLQIGTLPPKPIRRMFAHPNPLLALTAEPFFYTIEDVVAFDLRQDSLYTIMYDGIGWQILQKDLGGQRQ